LQFLLNIYTEHHHTSIKKSLPGDRAKHQEACLATTRGAELRKFPECRTWRTPGMSNRFMVRVSKG